MIEAGKPHNDMRMRPEGTYTRDESLSTGAQGAVNKLKKA